MDWQIALLIIIGGLLLLMVTGMPIAFAFMFINIVGAIIWWGGDIGLQQLIFSLYDSITRFALIPLPLFILMGEILFHSQLAPLLIESIDMWLGRLPGRLSLLSVLSGTLLSTLTGESEASIAMLGDILVPEMRRRGYAKSMSLGPILGSGGLAILIPPSGLAVFLGAVSQISIGQILMGAIIPGIILATTITIYIVLRCRLQPRLAPVYEVTVASVSQKLVFTAKHLIPVGAIIFMVIGVILLGIATPSEAAATGAMGCLLVAALYGKLNWTVFKKSVMGAFTITVMIFILIVGAVAFSRNLAFTGASRALAEIALSLPIGPIGIMAIMQVIIFIMGTFMDVGGIILITIPLYMPIVKALGFNSVWFAVIMLVNIEVAMITPPFGMGLFVMKSVAPADTTIGDIYRAAIPFVVINIVLMALIISFPQLALWLPGIMR